MTENSRLQQALRYYRRLERVHHFVDGHLGEEIRINEVARAAGIAPSYFSTFFHRKTGTHFRCWVSTLRIERSKALLSERNYSITEVAFAVGFSSVRTFERCFKKLVGTTPREFRRQAGPESANGAFDKDSVAFLQPTDATPKSPAS
jgi:AraC-like DNA-binding protein